MNATIENVHEYLTYKYEEFKYDDGRTEKGCLTVSWDCENEKIDDLMSNEFRGDLNEMGRKNLKWIDEVKKKANWVKGDKLTLFTKTNCDGNYYVWWNLDKSEYPSIVTVMIEPSGYAVLQHYNHYTSDSTHNPSSLMIRSESVYNDEQFDKLK